MSLIYVNARNRSDEQLQSLKSQEASNSSIPITAAFVDTAEEDMVQVMEVIARVMEEVIARVIAMDLLLQVTQAELVSLQLRQVRSPFCPHAQQLHFCPVADLRN